MYFAEVVAMGATPCGRQFSIQKFIPGLIKVKDWSDDGSVRAAMGDHAQMIGDKYGIFDIHWNNFGIMNDEPVLYDLGATYNLRGHPKVGDSQECECEKCEESRKVNELAGARWVKA